VCCRSAEHHWQQQERAAETAARTPAVPDAQSVEDLSALLTSAGER